MGNIAFENQEIFTYRAVGNLPCPAALFFVKQTIQFYIINFKWAFETLKIGIFNFCLLLVLIRYATLVKTKETRIL